MTTPQQVRLTLQLNANNTCATTCTALVSAEWSALVGTVCNKLRLKRKQRAALRLFIHGAGTELSAASPLDEMIAHGDVLAVSFGEEYAGPRSRRGAEPRAEPLVDLGAAGGSRYGGVWEVRSDALALVRWADARAMNDALGRMSTLLEHPALSAAAGAGVVSLERQRALPSHRYLGHNLYARTLRAFDALAADATEGERGFVDAWRAHGAPEVVISYVAGAAARATLAHELCHARYALRGAYAAAVDGAWAAAPPQLGKWMRDLGYHESRHADEFGAYVLTEADAFWRGRLSAEELRDARAALRPLATDDDELLTLPLGVT